MEDLKAYMESGVLELYVMGDLSVDEQRGVEQMASEYPEIRKELEEIERALNGYAGAFARHPNDELREKVIRQLTGDPANRANDIREIPLRSAPGFYKYAFAACVALLLVSWASMYNLYDQLNESKQTIVALRNANQQFASTAGYYERQLSDQKAVNRVLADPEFKFVDLKGTANAPKASMRVAFNKRSQEVMIDLAALEMPVNDKEHQYQLWALVDGKPVDLGVFDKRPDSAGMLTMKPIGHLQTFAVTLEPKGGSINPTLTQLMVAGNI